MKDRINRIQRNEEAKYSSTSSVKGMADVAYCYSHAGMDPSGYGVGAALLLCHDYSEREEQTIQDDKISEKWPVYAGSNINMTGFQHKVHAEQLAIQQAIMDIRLHDLKDVTEVRQMVVRTTDNDHALCCGNCLQMMRAFCNWVGTDPDEVSYISATVERFPEGNTSQKYSFDMKYVSDLLGETYCEL